ncbi:MAG: WxcM-like domain-containing protein [Lachnospiraceae bacterium]|jgi:WxcM-like, C-terminal.|nr:WxcM-like domain-containing protein [Lachnospiraceae bacterium]
MSKLDGQIRLLEWKDLGDERGNLVVVEGNMDIPFEIKRIFYIYGSDDTVVRGQHANRLSEFVMINVSGTSKVKVDNGEESRVIELNRPRMGLYLKNNIWKDMYDFSADSILLVLASEHYDESEYIRDYQEYLRFIKEAGQTDQNPAGK